MLSGLLTLRKVKVQIGQFTFGFWSSTNLMKGASNGFFWHLKKTSTTFSRQQQDSRENRSSEGTPRPSTAITSRPPPSTTSAPASRAATASRATSVTSATTSTNSSEGNPILYKEKTKKTRRFIKRSKYLKMKKREKLQAQLESLAQL